MVDNLRHVIERRLLETAQQIQIDSTTNCYDDQTVQMLFTCWRDLLTYFREHNDGEIGVEVVREYLDWLGKFSTMWHNTSATPNCQEWASEATYELEMYMDEIIKAVEQRRYPNGR